VLGVAAEELKDWRGERRDAADERRAQLRAVADEAEQARFDPILTQVERDGADASGTFGGDKSTGKDAPRDLDALTRMDLAERDTPVQGSEWPLDGVRRRVEALPGDVGQWRADRKERREERAREAVEAANAVPEAEADSTPERSRSQERADEYLQQLERDKLYADTRRGIATADIEDPDDELRQALYDRLNVTEAEHWTRKSDATKSGSEVWQGWKHPLKIPEMPVRLVKYIKERATGLAPLDASGSHFEVRRYLRAEDKETVIEEIFHQLKAGMSGAGEAGDMSLASTRLIHVKGGAYEEVDGKLVPTKALRDFQQLPRTRASGPDEDIRPATNAILPFEGPKAGSLPDQGRGAAAGGYELPPAPDPDPDPGAVEATLRPVDHNHPERKHKSEAEPDPEPAAEAESAPGAEPESQAKVDSARPVETVPVLPLEAKPEAEAETTKTGRKARRFRVQDPSIHPQLIDPNRPLEKRPYDGIARGARLNESGGEGLNTRRASRPEGPVAVSAPVPETAGRPEAPAPYVVEAPVRTEYSVRPGKLGEGEFTKFSETIHSIQDGDEAFGVAPFGQLLDTQVTRLLDVVGSEGALDSIKEEIIRRGKEERVFQRLLARSSGATKVEEEAGRQHSLLVEKQLMAKVKAQYGVLRGRERVKKTEAAMIDVDDAVEDNKARASDALNGRPRIRTAESFDDDVRERAMRASALNRAKPTDAGIPSKAEQAELTESGSRNSGAPDGPVAAPEQPGVENGIGAEFAARISAAQTRRELFDIARKAASAGLVSTNTEHTGSRTPGQAVSPLDTTESASFYSLLREADTDIASYQGLRRHLMKVEPESDSELVRVKGAFTSENTHEVEFEWTPEAVEAVLSSNPTPGVRNNLYRQLIVAGHLNVAEVVENGRSDLEYAGDKVRLIAAVEDEVEDEVGKFALEKMREPTTAKRKPAVEVKTENAELVGDGVPVEPEPEQAPEEEPIDESGAAVDESAPEIATASNELQRLGEETAAKLTAMWDIKDVDARAGRFEEIVKEAINNGLAVHNSGSLGLVSAVGGPDTDLGILSRQFVEEMGRIAPYIYAPDETAEVPDSDSANKRIVIPPAPGPDRRSRSNRGPRPRRRRS